MRWERLFADLEAQLDAARAAELAAEVADLTRAERATVPLVARLRAASRAPVAGPVTLRVAGGEVVAGTVVDLSEHWVLLADGPRRALVPLTAVALVAGLPTAAEPATDGQVARRLGLGHALRALARDRVTVRVTTEGGEVVGRLDRVGADHVDLSGVGDRPGGRPGPSVGGWTIPLAAIRVVRSG